jgi:hypothetical protein
MTLTNEQIQALFTFTEKKFVKWYDLQVELVDHLANKIEELMSEDKSLSFERALGNVYDKFGLFGFAHIVQEKENELHKRNKKLLLLEMKNQFNWPNVLRSLAILAVISTAIININVEIVAYLILILLLVDFCIFRISRWRKSRKQKPLLMTQILPSFNFSSFLYTQFLLFYLNDFYKEGFELSSVYKITLIALLFVGYIWVFSSKSLELQMINKAKKLYPVAFS